MKLKRLITDYLTRIRMAFHRRRRPARNYFRKSGQLCVPETLMECVDESGVASIGDCYRRSHPEWTAESPGEIDHIAASLSFRKRRQLLLDRISDDFERGNLVQVQGWILAQAEAEQCARLSANPTS